MIKKLVAKLFGLEVPAEPTVANENLTIKVVADTNSLNESLGITDKRAGELKKLAFTSLHNNHRLSDSAAEGSKSCKHPNELFYFSWVLSDMMHHMRQIGELIDAVKKGEKE